MFQPTIENCHLYLIYRLNMVIFHSCVSLPEGNIDLGISLNLL